MAQLKNTVVNGSLKVNGRAETNILITDEIKKTDGTSYVGNGTITIKQGEVTKGTFSVNQGSDQTINLESFNADTHISSHGTNIEQDFHNQLYLGSFNSAMKKVARQGVVNYGLNPEFFSSMLVRLNSSSNGALSNLRSCINSLYTYLYSHKNNTYLTSHIGLLSIPSRTLEDAAENEISPSNIENNSRPWIYSVVRNGDTNIPASSILLTDFIKTYVMNISDGTISRISVDADTLNGKTSTDFASSNHSHNYLPLSGGTLTGDLKLGSSIKIKDNEDNSLLAAVNNTTYVGDMSCNLVLQSNSRPLWKQSGHDPIGLLIDGDLVPNSKEHAGYVLAGNGHSNQAWMTDANGNPAWRNIVTEDTNTWRPISINDISQSIGNNPLILKAGNNITISKNQGIVTFDATVPSVSNYSLASYLTNKQIDITLQKDSTNTNTISLNFTNSSIVKNNNKYTITAPTTPINALNQAGSVIGPTANTRNCLWGTDNNGNPGWKAIRTFLCGTSPILTPTTPVIFNSDYFAVNNQSSGFTLSVKKADTATTANSATNATNAEHANSADTATTANSATNATNATKFNGWLIDYDNGDVDTRWICAFESGNPNGRTIRAMDSTLFARKTDLENVKLTATGDRNNPVFINAEGKPQATRSFTGLVEASVANNVLTLTIL